MIQRTLEPTLKIDFWRKLLGDPEAPAALIHGGERSYRRNGIAVYSWDSL
jgi:hypothetical protein